MRKKHIREISIIIKQIYKVSTLYSSTTHSMGKYNKIVSNIMISLSLTGAVYGQNTKIDKIALPIKKDLIDNIKSNKDVTPIDKETETIIAFMSNLDNGEMKTLLKEY